MPKIPQYSYSKAPIEIPQRGVEALATAGRRVGSLGQEEAAMTRQAGADISKGLGSFKEIGASLEKLGQKRDAHDGQQDVIGVSAVAASLQNKLSQQWRQVVASGDHDKIEAFQQDAQDQIGDLYNSAQTDAGREFATRQAATLNMHWGNMINEGAAQMQAGALVGNLNTMTQHLSSSLTTDPSHLPLALRQIEDTFHHAAQSGALDPAAASKLVTEEMPKVQRDVIRVAGKATADAAAANGGDPNVATQSFLKSYGDRIGGQHSDELTTYASNRTKIAANDLYLKQQNDAKVAQTNSDAAIGPLFQQTLAGMQGTHVIPSDLTNQIMHNPNLTPATQAAYTAAIGAIATGRAATAREPDAFDDALRGLNAAPGTLKAPVTPTTLLNGVAHGDITSSDAHFLLTSTPEQRAQLQSAMQYGRSVIAPTDPTTGKVDPVKLGQYGSYQDWVMKQSANGVVPDMKAAQDKLPSITNPTVPEGPGLFSRIGADIKGFFTSAPGPSAQPEPAPSAEPAVTVEPNEEPASPPAAPVGEPTSPLGGE